MDAANDQASQAASTYVPTVLASLVAVGVFLAIHVTIVLHVAFGEILSDIVVAFDVTYSYISMFVSIDSVEIPMRRGLALRIVLAVIGIGGRACEKQCGAGK